MAISDAAVEQRSPDAGAGPVSGGTEPSVGHETARGRSHSGVGVTAAAAVVAGVLLLTRDQSIATLGTLAIAVGALALIVTAAALREWPWARQWTGPDGALDGVAGPMAWLAVVFAAVVILTNFVPVIVPGWTKEQVFAVAIVVFILISVLGWGPGVQVAWPAGLRLSSMTVLGSLVGLILIAVFLILMLLMRSDAMVADDSEWARLVEIRATLESLAFAAAGVLLGILVQRQALSGELRGREELIGQREEELHEARARVADGDLRAESLTASATAAVRLLTPDAPDGFEGLDPAALAALPTRPSATAVRQARLTLLEALRAVSER